MTLNSAAHCQWTEKLISLSPKQLQATSLIIPLYRKPSSQYVPILEIFVLQAGATSHKETDNYIAMSRLSIPGHKCECEGGGEGRGWRSSADQGKKS